MDDNSKTDVRIDVGQLPAPEDNGGAVPIISMSTLLVIAGFCAIGLRLFGIGEDIIELGFAIGFLVFVKHYFSRLKRLEMQNSSKGPQSVGKTVMVLGALLAGSFLLIHNDRQLWYGWGEGYRLLSVLIGGTGSLLMVGGFLIWLKNH